LFIQNEKLRNSSLQSLPLKAIEVAYKRRKNKNERSMFSIRRDVVHKAIFRAMRRFYATEFESMHKHTLITKENYKDLVQNFLSKIIDEFNNWSEFLNPTEALSKDGIVLVMMVIISQPLTKSWSYKMKSASFVRYFNTFMSKYSYALMQKLFENFNFRLLVKTFLNSEGFEEAMQTTLSMKENQDVYESAAKTFLNL